MAQGEECLNPGQYKLIQDQIETIKVKYDKQEMKIFNLKLMLLTLMKKRINKSSL